MAGDTIITVLHPEDTRETEAEGEGETGHQLDLSAVKAECHRCRPRTKSAIAAMVKEIERCGRWPREPDRLRFDDGSPVTALLAAVATRDFCHRHIRHACRFFTMHLE